MLASVGAVYGAGALGVVLTGMGRDGVEGATRLVACGGAVLAQDEASCAVWGMPRAVLEAGLACAVAAARHDRAPDCRADRGVIVQISDSSSRILAGLLEARTGQQLTLSRRWRIETALSALMREREYRHPRRADHHPGDGQRAEPFDPGGRGLAQQRNLFLPRPLAVRHALAPCLARARQAAAQEQAHPHLVGRLLDRAGSLFAGDAVRRGAGSVARLDRRYPRQRRFDLVHRARAQRRLHPVRGPARPRHQPDDQMVRGMRRTAGARPSRCASRSASRSTICSSRRRTPAGSTSCCAATSCSI